MRQIPPAFTRRPKGLYRVGRGQALNITCVAVGYPMPRVYWKSGANRIRPPSLMAADPIGKNVLKLPSVQSSLELSCEAASALGHISTKVEVGVQGGFCQEYIHRNKYVQLRRL